ncbi:MAG: tyrosine-type recombinase/integrase [Fusobacteriaceae bacterium]
MEDNLRLLEKYINSLKEYGRNSEETIEIYRREVDDFLVFIDQAKIVELEDDVQMRYVEKLKKSYSPLSVKRKIASISGFYKYLIKKSKLDYNPFLDIKIFLEKKDNSPKITEGEIRRIIDYCKDDFKGKRDRLVIHLLFISGLKINQILKIRKENIINFSEISILEKNGIEVIKLDLEGIEILKKYLEEIESKKEENLFENFTRQSFRARFMNYSKKAGIVTPISPIEIKKSVIEKKKECIDQNNFFQEMKKEYMRIRIGDE